MLCTKILSFFNLLKLNIFKVLVVLFIDLHCIKEQLLVRGVLVFEWYCIVLYYGKLTLCLSYSKTFISS